MVTYVEDLVPSASAHMLTDSLGVRTAFHMSAYSIGVVRQHFSISKGHLLYALYAVLPSSSVCLVTEKGIRGGDDNAGTKCVQRVSRYGILLYALMFGGFGPHMPSVYEVGRCWVPVCPARRLYAGGRGMRGSLKTPSSAWNRGVHGSAPTQGKV